MRHVREEVPDVQQLRPRGLRRDRRRRRTRHRQGPRASATPTPPSMVADLEEALAIEAARSGQATGEVTTVLRTLPGARAGGCPGACATPRAGSRSLGAARRDRRVALVARRRADAQRHGRRPRRARPRRAAARAARPDRRPRLQPVRHRPRKPRPRAERRRQRPNTTGAPSTTTKARCKRPAASGSGVYLDAAPACGAGGRDPDAHARVRRADLRRPTHRSRRCPTATPRRSPRAAGTDRSARAATSTSRERIPLAGHRRRYRYYLIWLTTLPPGRNGRRRGTLFRDARAEGRGRLRRRVSRLSGAAGFSSGTRAAAAWRSSAKPAQALDELRVGDARRLQQLRVDARRREPGHRVELVQQHAARRPRRSPPARGPRSRSRRTLQRQLPHLLGGAASRCARGPAAPSPRACTSPRSRTTRPPEDDLARLATRAPRAAPARARPAACRARRTRPRRPRAIASTITQRVVRERLAPARLELIARLATLTIPTEEPRWAGLTNTGRPSSVELGEHAPRRLRAERSPRTPAVGRPAGRPPAAISSLNSTLSMHTADGRDAGADVGDVERLEHPLHRPVLAERAVQDRETPRPHPSRPAAGVHAHGARPPRRQAPSRADLDPQHLVAAREQPSRTAAARGKRDVVLGGAPAGEHRHRQRSACRRRSSPVIGRGRGRCRRAVVVVRGRRRAWASSASSASSSPSTPTVIVTVEPLRAAARRRGSASARPPPALGSLVVPRTDLRREARPPSAAAACASLCAHHVRHGHFVRTPAPPSGRPSSPCLTERARRRRLREHGARPPGPRRPAA